jgi:hypothetical protein
MNMYRFFGLAAGAVVVAACAAGDPVDKGPRNGADGSAGMDGALDSGSSTSGGDGEACAIVEVEAEPKILDMVVLLDRSLSMSSSSKWDGATRALSSFFNDPTSAGINASLVFFPNPGELSSNGPQCDISKYDPDDAPHVTLGELPAHASALDTAMDAQIPSGFTPTQHALQGIVPFAMARRLANPDHEVIIVVATDGLPAGCSDVTDETIYDEAAAAAAVGVGVYAIAFDGAKVEWIDGLAQAGGTTAGIDVTSDIDQFSDAMVAIRDANLGCSFSIPDPTETAFDKHRVNVTIEHMGSDIELTKVDSSEQCAGNTSWYYDDEDAPTSIRLCDAPCSQYGTNEQAAISIVFGCPTKLN